MVELFVYDGAGINRPNCRYETRKDHPIFKWFIQALTDLNPPKPFLVRTIFGDFKDKPLRGWSYTQELGYTIKNTFEGRTISSLLSNILENGHDKVGMVRSEDEIIDNLESRLIRRKGLKYCDVMWATKYVRIEEALPYRFDDDMGENPQGRINDLSIVINARFYTPSNKRDEALFYQPVVQLRRKALLGIIISDTNPKRRKKEPLRFTLTKQNLEKVVKKIQATGYLV